ncbi:MAG: hypothetical protein ACKO7D_06220 [Bacteroidota bacterium]
MKITLFNIAVLLFAFQLNLFGQKKIDDKTLDKLFWEGKYNEVEQDYYILYLQNLNNPEVCFKYGTSLLFESDSIQNLVKANNLLLFSASQSSSLAEYHFYCGRAYHARSKFDSALVQFDLYKSKKDKKTVELPVDEFISYCKNGKSLQKISIGNFERQLSEISYDKIGLAYSLPQIKLNGEFINYNTELTKIDIKKGNKPVRYVSDYSTKYFASFGEKDEGHKDLYMVEGTRDQKKITKLPDFINTKEDEDFPYFDFETNYLYFSSRGHNSIGGYDIFRVDFDTVTETFGKVENLGIGISTPFDDFLFIHNSSVNQALITSGYLGKTNTYAIYRGNISIPDKVKTKKQEVLATFKNEINSTIKLSEIEVIDKNTGEKVGNFKVDETGKTLMNLSPGNYTYVLSIYGSQDDFKADISIPTEDDQIVHEITYKIDDKNNEKVVINTGDSESNELIAQNIKKDSEKQNQLVKSNETSSEKENLIDPSLENEALKKLEMVGYNQNEVVDRVSDKIIEIELAQKENEQLMSNLNVVIVNNRAYFDELQQEIDSLEQNLEDASEIDKLEKLNYIKNLVSEQKEVLSQTLWMQNLNDSLHTLNSESNPEKRKFIEIQELGNVIQELTVQNKYEDAYVKIINKHEQIQSLTISPVYERIYSDLHENELEEVRIEKNLLSLSTEYRVLTEDLKNIDIDISTASKKEKIQLESKREEIEQKINSNQKRSNAYLRDLNELKTKTAEFELKRNLISNVAKEVYEETVSYEDAKKKYFDNNMDYQRKIDVVQAKIEESNSKLTSNEKKYFVIVESYQTKKNTLDENLALEELIELEKELATNIKKLLSEENQNVENSSSSMHENYLQEKLQESESRLKKLLEENTSLASSSDSNEQNSSENSNSNVAKNQTTNSQNNQQNQTNSSSNSNKENEENSSENSNSNVAKNQTANSQNNQQNQTNSSSNSNKENEENSSENSNTNVAKNQTTNSKNNQQNQSNSSSNSNKGNEENSSENSNSSIAKNQTANSHNNQQNQTNSSFNSNKENEETSSENSSSNVTINQTKYIPEIKTNITEVKNEELIEASNEFTASKKSVIEELNKSNPTISLQSTNQLNYEKSKIENQLSSLEKEIEELKVEQKNQKKKKEVDKIENSIIEKEQQIAFLTIEKTELEDQINKQEQKEISLKMEKGLISIEEQKSQEILASDGYKEYVTKIVQFEQEKENYDRLTKNLETQQNKLNELINIQVLTKDKRNGSVEIESLVKEIEKSQKLKETSYKKLEELKKSVEKIEQKNPTTSDDMKILAANRKEPLTKIEQVKDEILSSGGFEINATSTASSTDNKTIPMNVKTPSGLIYRVQVGAFRKPLQNNVYSQFTPVSGELQQNGLIVYMAGYFNSSSNAINARKQIQSLGYSDAFIVAYCNGKKLTLGEARLLEAKGECIPQGDNEFLVEISKNTQEALKEQNKNSSTTSSMSIDTKSLYYTVQIGVYNKPINEKEKFPNLTEISTSISPKKQIRYATGKFSDLNKAKTRKNEAVASGISDAFIVAYYQGERITIAQATELLSKNESILYSESQQSTNSSFNNSVQYVENEVKIFKKTKPVEKIETIKYEVNTVFEELPIEKIAYFNKYGWFQFDAKSGKLRSTEFTRQIDLADDLKLSGLVTEIREYDNTNEKNELKLKELNGDLMDVLLRTSWINSIESSKEISLILNTNFSTSENYTNLLKNTFELKIESYDKK